MTVANAPQFKNLEEYLGAAPSELPEGRFEYWDRGLVPVMPESIANINIATYLLALLIQAGFSPRLLCPGQVEVVVPGEPKTRYPDFTVLDEVHIALLNKKATITQDMPPPRLLVEVVSPGSEGSENYRRDYEEKVGQYAAIRVPEYWIVDPERRAILVGTLVDGLYEFRRYEGEDGIVSPVFPGFKMTVAELLG